jgi:hypothetical protein
MFFSTPVTAVAFGVLFGLLVAWKPSPPADPPEPPTNEA